MQIFFKKKQKKQQRHNFGCLHYFTLKQNNEIISQKAKTTRGRIIIHFGLQFSGIKVRTLCRPLSEVHFGLLEKRRLF